MEKGDTVRFLGNILQQEVHKDLTYKKSYEILDTKLIGDDGSYTWNYLIINDNGNKVWKSESTF